MHSGNKQDDEERKEDNPKESSHLKQRYHTLIEQLDTQIQLVSQVGSILSNHPDDPEGILSIHPTIFYPTILPIFYSSIHLSIYPIFLTVLLYLMYYYYIAPQHLANAATKILTLAKLYQQKINEDKQAQIISSASS